MPKNRKRKTVSNTGDLPPLKMPKLLGLIEIWHMILSVLIEGRKELMNLLSYFLIESLVDEIPAGVTSNKSRRYVFRISNPTKPSKIPWVVKIILWDTKSECQAYMEKVVALKHLMPTILVGTSLIIDGSHTSVIIMEDGGLDLLNWYNEKYLQYDFLDDSLDGEISDVMEKCRELLRKLHARGYVHGDIKPENFLIKYKRNDKGIDEIKVTLIDFETVVKVDKESASAFTFEYASDNRLRGGPAKFEDDIWSLGMTHYVLFTGVIGRTKTSMEYSNGYKL